VNLIFGGSTGQTRGSINLATTFNEVRAVSKHSNIFNGVSFL